MVILPNLQEVEDMLASDDELPNDYREFTVTDSAGKDSDELDDVLFPWLNNKNVKHMHKEVNEETGETAHAQIPFILNETTLNERSSQLSQGERMVVMKGLLSKRDIVSLKSIINARPGDGTILWFVNYLMHKDLQSQYSFLRSCLVNTYNEEPHESTNRIKDKTNHNFYVRTF